MVMPFQEFDRMCASCITGAVYADYCSIIVYLGAETVFAYNTAKYGGTSVKYTELHCISGNAKHRVPREVISLVTFAPLGHENDEVM